MILLRTSCALLVTGLLMALAAAGPASARPDKDAVLSPLGMVIENPPTAVLGADGRNHLAYEITIINQTSSEVRIDRVQPRARGRAFGPPLSGDKLASLLRVNGAEGPAIPGGGSAMLFMDVTYARRGAKPRSLTHGFNLTLSAPGESRQQVAFVGVPTEVGTARAIEVAPPLRGPGWVVGNGCCDPINAHRGATLSIDGTVHAPERFAIDFVQLGTGGRLFEGPIDMLSSWRFFGARIYSATAGRVVAVQDGLPEQTPGALPIGQTVQTAGGNYLVVKIGQGRFAFYAHMQRGSMRVGKGDRVRKGQLLGLLGNTGNSDGPHLHFHIMDGPSPLQANGLPFVYTRFSGQGRITDEQALVSGEIAPIDSEVLAGRFRNRMPLGNQVIDFGG
jgi:Peptidase family M23